MQTYPAELPAGIDAVIATQGDVRVVLCRFGAFEAVNALLLELERRERAGDPPPRLLRLVDGEEPCWQDADERPVGRRVREESRRLRLRAMGCVAVAHAAVASYGVQLEQVARVVA